jgi:hypothetical protein
MLSLIADPTNLGAVRNRSFIRAFAEALPASKRGGLTGADGTLSAEGLARAKNAILAKAFGDREMIARVTASTDADIKTISDGLVAVAEQWVRFRSEVDAGRVRADLDQTAELTEAVKRIADIRARGQKLYEYLAQQDAPPRPDDNRTYRVNTEIMFWIRQCYKPDRRVADAQHIAQTLRLYTEEASKVATDQRLNPGMPEVKPDELQCRVLRRLHAA